MTPKEINRTIEHAMMALEKFAKDNVHGWCLDYDSGLNNYACEIFGASQRQEADAPSEAISKALVEAVKEEL